MAPRNGAHELTARLPLPWLVVAAAIAAVAATDFSGLYDRQPDLISRVPTAIVANGALALGAVALRTVTTSGALSGAIVGATLLVTSGWSGWALLGWAFALTVATTRWRRHFKEGRDIAEARGGRRGSGNVWANTGVAALLSVTAASRPNEAIWIIATAAALAAGATDTVASEIGKAIGGRTWLPPTFRPVPPGTTGGISSSGTLAAVIAGASFGVIGWLNGLLPALVGGLVVAAAATASCILEGSIALATEERGVLDNDGVNFVATAMAAAIAAVLSIGLM